MGSGGGDRDGDQEKQTEVGGVLEGALGSMVLTGADPHCPCARSRHAHLRSLSGGQLSHL